MITEPKLRKKCFECGEVFDLDTPNWIQIPETPPKWVHLECGKGKTYRIPGNPSKPGEPPQANILITVGNGHSPRPPKRSKLPEDDPKYWPRKSSDMCRELDESPVARFVFKILLDAIKDDWKKIVLERLGRNFTVSYEKDAERSSAASPPVEYWQPVISRLKVMAYMVDAGPKKSVDGEINIRLSKNRAQKFTIPNNPNPFKDNIVTLSLEPSE